MTTTIARRGLFALAVLAAAVFAVGCGSDGPGHSCKTEAHLIDTTGSTAPYRGGWPVELTKSAYETLRDGNRFVASTFTSGGGTVDWVVDRDGCESGETRRRRQAQWAARTTAGIAKDLAALTRSRTRGGSDPLAALEAASKLPDLAVVRIWSDLVVQDDGVDLSRPVPPARIDRLVDRWAPRLEGLDGVRVVALHAGRGVDSDVAIRQSERLLRTVLNQAGATLEWQPVLRGSTTATATPTPTPPRAQAAQGPPSCIHPRGIQPISFSATRYPSIRAHALAAQARGWPRTLVLNREESDARRERLLQNVPTRDGLDRDEYPPAVGRGRGAGLTAGTDPLGWRADVRYVPSAENRSHGARLGIKLRRFCDGTRFRYVFY